MNENRFLTTLGLARRAAKLTYGHDMVLENRKDTALLLVSEDAAPRALRHAQAAAAARKIPLKAIPYTKEALGAALGTKPVALIGVTDRGFAATLAKILEGGN